jgi:hypothetical protein
VIAAAWWFRRLFRIIPNVGQTPNALQKETENPMNKLHWKLAVALLLSSAHFAQAAPDYFRLEPGSLRVFRAANSESTFSIRVSSVGFMHDDHVHYQVTGYAERPLKLYVDEHTGALYHLDEETDHDVLVTSVEKGPGWFQANYRACDQEGRVEEHPAVYLGPAGWFNNALALQYRAFGCNDTGIEAERYVENLGLVQRTLQTFAGPVEYYLVYASLGSTTIHEEPSSVFSISVRPGYGPVLIADLHYSAMGQDRILEMPASQDYDVVLRNSSGNVVWRYSTGKFFTPTIRNVSSRHLSYTVEIPLQFYGILLQEGVYTVEAWLATNPERQFAASIQFVYEHPSAPGERSRR